VIFTYQETLAVGEPERCERKKKRKKGGKLWKRATLSITAPMGNLKENSFTRDSERQ
jgi:hypothetical protein